MIPIPKVPPPGVMLIHILSALLLGWFFPLPIPSPVWMNGIGVIITLGGLWLAWQAVSQMRQHGVSPAPQSNPPQLLTGGIYQRTRNPIYLAYIIAGAGIPLALGTYWGLVLIPLGVDMFNRFVITNEEARLEKLFGREYSDYKSRVKRWL